MVFELSARFDHPIWGRREQKDVDSELVKVLALSSNECQSKRDRSKRKDSSKRS
jgi:hypothetical protein